MHIRSPLAIRLGLAVGLVCLPMLGWTQGTTPAQEDIWRKANEAVGQFPRGHVDVLKWEQSNASPESVVQSSGESLVVANVQDAIRMAWKLHPDLKPAITQLSADTLDAIVSGRWDAVDVRLIRRVDGVSELLGIAAQARKDWVNAVAAQLGWQQSRQLLQAAESARELGDRMVKVGNWSKIQQAPLQMAHAAAQMDIQKSRLAWVQAQNRLLKSLGQTGMYQTLAIPSRMPDLPKSTIAKDVLQSRGKAIQGQLYFAERFVNRDNQFLANAAYQAAFENAKLANEILKLRQFVTEETALHYNGMLKSTWDVLTEAQSQIQATTAAVNAQRDFEMAQIDLDWVLLGGEPSGFVTLGGGDGAPAAAGQ